jgi:hypothetical protein
MSEMTMSQTPDDLDWLAFCYAAGEMSASDAEAFEARLATDQSAREALARAVELSETVATAESLGAVVAVSRRPAVWSRRLGWIPRLGWMAMGSAASLLVALLWSGVGRWSGEASPPPRDHSQLAAAWTQTRQELAENDSDLWYLKHLALSETSDAAASFHGGDADLLESVTPDWLTAAVETYPSQPTDADETPFDGERREN